MLEAYFDESGIHDGATVCAVAGYYGDPVQWGTLARKWSKVLRDFDFPLKDFSARNLVRKPEMAPMLAALSRAIAYTSIYQITAGIITGTTMVAGHPQHSLSLRIEKYTEL